MINKKMDIINRCLNLYVPSLSDGADEVGLGHVCMDFGIKPMTTNQRMAGFARTGKLVRSAVQRPYDEAQLDSFMSLATNAETGDLIVMNMGGAADCSGWGMVLTQIAIPKGVQGTVVDGTVRDIDAINEHSYPVFARGRHPGTMRGRLDVESIDEPIICGGVTVNPGDLVFGDGDGVVVIPKDKIRDVLHAAEEIVGTDLWWSKKLDEGKDPHELHKEKPIP